MKLRYFLIVLMFLFLISFTSAAPPVTTVQYFPDGYTPIGSPQEYLKQGQDYQYNFFVQNSSNGALITNTSVNCTFYMADSTGEVKISSDVPYFEDGHWGIDIDGANFSDVGIYCYGVKCTDGFGGHVIGCWEVTSTGYEFTIQHSIFYIILFSIIFFVLAITMFGINLLPRYNQTDEDGKILSISYLKYLRLPLWLFAYMLFTVMIWLTSNIAYAFLVEEMFGKLLFSIFAMLLAVSPVIIIVIVISFFVQFFHDKQFQNMLNRGMFPGGTV